MIGEFTTNYNKLQHQAPPTMIRMYFAGALFYNFFLILIELIKLQVQETFTYGSGGNITGKVIIRL